MVAYLTSNQKVASSSLARGLHTLFLLPSRCVACFLRRLYSFHFGSPGHLIRRYLSLTGTVVCDKVGIKAAFHSGFLQQQRTIPRKVNSIKS
jgi:hypothetical protein